MYLRLVAGVVNMDNWLVYVLVWWLASAIFGVAVGFAIKKMGGGDTGY